MVFSQAVNNFKRLHHIKGDDYIMWICPVCKVNIEDLVNTCPTCGKARPQDASAQSSKPVSVPNPAAGTSAPNGADTASAILSDGPVNIQWNYSGKSFRFSFILHVLLTIVFIGLGLYFMYGKSENTSEHSTIVWCVLLGIPVICWIWYYIRYWYYTRFIIYRLTEAHLYFEQGLLHRTIDTMELIGVNDLKMRQTLWDRVVNGGVGIIDVYSVSDQTNGVLSLRGLENPQDVLEKIDNARRRLRGRGYVQM